MNDEDVEKFKVWVEAQPKTVRYSEAKRFLSQLLDINKAEAEYEIALLSKENKLRIIQTKRTKTPQRRIFFEPLEDLTEDHIRAVWNGSSDVMTEVQRVAEGVRDRTGHNIEDIVELMVECDSIKFNGDTFRWISDNN